MTDSPYLVEPGKKFNLKGVRTDDTGPFADKKAAKAASEASFKALGDLQELLYAEAKHALLVVLQAMGTGGSKPRSFSTASSLVDGAPACEMPVRSPLTSAMNTGTPMRLKPSASLCSTFFILASEIE